MTTGFDFRRVYATTVIACLVSYLVAVPVRADVTLDGSLGPSGSLTGPNYAIPASDGEQVGPNLFHSFGVFNINSDESATFTGPNGIENVLGRVTGGDSSSIDGELNSAIPGANLYLINPAGIMFGPNAQLNVDGSFHASTADYVRLGPEGMFSATNPGTSTLTVAPPSAFGFLSLDPAPITMQGSELAVPDGETFSITGGDIRIEGGVVAAPGGRINLASVASQGEAKLAGGTLNVDSFARLGDIEISQGAVVNASGETGGDVVVRGGDVLIGTGAGVFAATIGGGDAGKVSINVSGDLIVNGGLIGTDSDASGAAGTVAISANRVILQNGGQVGSGSRASGNSGSVLIDASKEIRISGSNQLNFNSGIQVAAFGERDAGNVFIHAPIVIVENGGFMTAESRGIGGSGTILITADKLLLNNGSIDANSFGRGDAGQILVDVGHVTLSGGAQISSGTFGTGSGGDVFLHMAGDISVSGNNSGLFTDAKNGFGDAGNIIVFAGGNLNVNDGAIISSESSNKSTGDAGDIIIKVAGTAQLADGSIVAKADNTSGGNIRMSADRIQLTRGSGITTSVSGGPKTTGGTLTFNGLSLVMLDDSRAKTTATQGNGGFIQVNSQVFLHDGKLSNVLDTRSRRGNNGTVEVNSPDTDIAGSITRLPVSFLNAAALLSERCAARSAEDTSSFVIVGRGGVPRGPDDWSMSSYVSGASGARKVISGGIESASESAKGKATPRIAMLRLSCAHQP